MHSFLLEMFACPACYGTLEWNIMEQRDDRIEAAEALCTACGAVYPVREGIGLFLTSELPRNDLWEQSGSQLTHYLIEHPEIEQQLMLVPVETLSPADQFLRALVLEEREDYTQAKIAADLARSGLYTPEYLTCSTSQVNYLVEELATTPGPIVDLASGRGELVQVLAQKINQPVIATDFSPRVLRCNRRWLQFLGLYERVTLLAFDARRTPFKNRAVKTLTTFVGLPNIDQPGLLLRELRRIVTGTLFAISHFFPEDDEANASAISEKGHSALLFRRSALEQFAAAGWQVELANTCTGQAKPTPASLLIEGLGIDGLPVADTVLEWSVLVAR
jgi:uncharacterized protein YbaR (Trm112 family)